MYNDAVNDPKIKRWLGQVVGKEGEDLSRHDKWLCMMYPRLQLLKKLLSPSGVIFVSIDDEEVKHLRLVMDEIFSASRFIGQFIWKSRQNKDNRTKNGASIDHEYVLCYGNRIRGDGRNLTLFGNHDNDPRGQWTSGNMVGLASKEARPNLHYDLIDSATGINYGCPKQGWRYDQARMLSLIADGRILWPASSDGRPRQKVYLSEMTSEYTGFSSVLNFDLYTYHGTREIEQIFGSRVFDFPKSSDFVLKLIEQAATSPSAIILDSFAGSGTTAHAVLKLNAQDDGKRRFILIETMGYAENITAERIRRVMQGYGDGDKSVDGLGGEFDYYTVGERLMQKDGMLNPAVGLPAIRDYVAWTEGIPVGQCTAHSPTTEQQGNASSPYWMGEAHGLGLFFVWEDKLITTLDLSLLSQLVKQPGRYLIYADQCALGEDFLRRHNIVYKKIPRDITRL